jgi:hypothetical protein
MREHPLVPTIRLALLCIAAVCLWHLCPEASLCCLPMFLFPSCTCCGTPGTDCTHCDTGTAHGIYQIVITNMANGTCTDCASFNATWVVTQDLTFAPTCWFPLTISPAICTADRVQFTIGGTFTSYEMYAGFYVSPSSPTPAYLWRWQKSDNLVFSTDCNLSGTSFTRLNTDAKCDYSTSTCTLTGL